MGRNSSGTRGGLQPGDATIKALLVSLSLW